MGFYINPPVDIKADANRDEKIAAANNKFDWLMQQGAPLHNIPKWEDIPEGQCIVCCVENGFFQAACICYKPSELRDFADPSDHRPKTWFFLDKKLAIDNSNIAQEDFQ